MPPDKRKMGDDGSITSSELEYILDVNKKAVEIHLEVGKQNEEIINYLNKFERELSALREIQKEHFAKAKDGINFFEKNGTALADLLKKVEDVQNAIDDNKETIEEIEKDVEDIEKNIFRLVIILGSAGLGALITIIQAFFHK